MKRGKSNDLLLLKLKFYFENPHYICFCKILFIKVLTGMINIITILSMTH